MVHIAAKYAHRERALTIALGTSLAVLFVVLAVLQLASFEKLPIILTTLWVLDDKEAGLLVAALIAVAEVFALPYLLGMQLSKAMRGFSGVLAFVAAGYWLAIGWRTAMASVMHTDTGLGGTYLRVPGGAWLLWFSIGILILLAWYTVRLVLESKK